MLTRQACCCLLIACGLLGPAGAVPKGFVLSDDAVGATCQHYLRMGSLAWERPLGDWLDRTGQRYGDQAYASQEVKVQAGRQVVEFDVSALVKQWLAAPSSNQGLLLRAVPGPLKGVVEFHSRESADLGGRPMLKLQWANGERSRLAPAADTTLDCSSIASLGGQSNLKVSNQLNALLRFELPTINSTLQQATLYLVSDTQYGSGSKVGVFMAQPPFLRADPAIQQGLAAKYPRDQGIGQDKAVMFATGFENRGWQIEWGEYATGSDAETLESDPERLFVPLSGKALRARLAKGKNLGLDLRYLFARARQAEPEAIYFRYYLRFADDWNPTLDGGKLPGIAGTYGRAGWGMRKSDGLNGWSARGGFAARPAGARSVQNLTAIYTYSYHADGKDASGDIWPWALGPAGLLENNRWYAVEQYLKLNTPGRNDGVMRAWLDGRLVMEKTDIRFRDTAELKIESIWLNVYHGGAAPSPRDMSLYIDNVVVAQQYIGPMKP